MCAPAANAKTGQPRCEPRSTPQRAMPAAHLVKQGRRHDADEAGAADGAQALRRRVEHASEGRDLLGQHEGPRDGRVDVAACGSQQW